MGMNKFQNGAANASIEVGRQYCGHRGPRAIFQKVKGNFREQGAFGKGC